MTLYKKKKYNSINVDQTHNVNISVDITKSLALAIFAASTFVCASHIGSIVFPVENSFESFTAFLIADGGVLATAFTLLKLFPDDVFNVPSNIKKY